MRFPLPRLRSEAASLVILAALWWSAVYLTGSPGSVPLGDDWSFATAAFRLASGEGYNPPDWAAMTLVVHALWGAFLAKVFGMNFVVLRGGMLVLGLLCGILFWIGLRRLGTPSATAAVAVATLLFNPLYFAVSQSFMTDVTFLTLLVAQAFCLMKCVDSELSWRWIAWSSVTTVLAALTRDPGVIPALVMSFVVFVERRNRSALRAALPFVAGLLAIALFRYWARSAGIDLSHSDFFRDLLIFNIKAMHWQEWIWKIDSVLMYTGFFALPLLLPVVVRLLHEGGTARTQAICGFAAGLTFVGGCFAISGNHFPPEAGWMDETGFVGTPLLYDVTILHASEVPRVPHWMVDVVTAAAIMGGALLVSAMTAISALPARQRRWAIFCASAALATNVQWILMEVYFDRYALPGVVLILFTCCIVLSVRPASRPTLPLGATIVLFFAVWSVAGVRDFFDWQRARWVALEYLTGPLKIPPNRIDGGFEFNGWHVEKHPIPYKEYAFIKEPVELPTDRSWWWVGDPEYMVAFGPVPGYGVIATFPYTRWMPGRSDWAIHVLRRTGIGSS